MNKLITAAQAADIYGVTLNLMNSARMGVGAPDAVVSERQRNTESGHLGKMTVLYDEDQVRAWASENDFWLLAMDYRHRQRNGDAPRVRKATRRQSPKTVASGERGAELLARDEAVALRPALKDFLLGKFAPAPVRVAQDMKLVRARINKPKTRRVSINNDGGW